MSYRRVNEKLYTFITHGRLSQSEVVALKKNNKTKTDTFLPYIQTLIKIVGVINIDARRALQNIA
jgi:hypothetical protein